MTLKIDDKILKTSKMSESEMQIEIAIMLFEKEKITFGQARRLSGLDVLTFQKKLGERKIPMHYYIEDLRHDLRTLSSNPL